jgi:hypothetical protein
MASDIRYMIRHDLLAPFNVCEGAGDHKHAVVSARREGGSLEERKSFARDGKLRTTELTSLESTRATLKVGYKK